MSVWLCAAWLEATSDYTLVGALATAIAALTTVVGILWFALNKARDKHEKLLQQDRDELVPEMVKFSDAARTMIANSEKLLEESMKLRNLRHRSGHGGDSQT